VSIVAHTSSRTLYGAPLLKRKDPSIEDRRAGRPLTRRSSFNRNLLGLHGGSIEPVARIAGAVWQAGLTPFNWRFKVMLDGEPCRDAIAASDAAGWVDVQLYGEGPDGYDPFARGTVRKTGRVRIIAGDYL